MRDRIDAATLDIKEKVVNISRVAKVVKGRPDVPLPARWSLSATRTVTLGAAQEKRPKSRMQSARALRMQRRT